MFLVGADDKEKEHIDTEMSYGILAAALTILGYSLMNKFNSM